MNFISNLVEYQNWGLNILTISALGTLFFTILQVYGACDQNKKIWSKKPLKSVSLLFFAYNCSYFSSLFCYGFFKHSLAMILNGLLLFFFLPIVIGVWKFKKNTAKEKFWAVAFLLIVPLMIIMPQKDLLFMISLFGIACFFSVQLRKIMVEKDFSSLSLKLVIILLATVIFWLGYSIAIHNLALEINSALAIILYAFAIFLYFKYRKKS
jgi:uncharacterized protein with PQ loop repeat